MPVFTFREKWVKKVRKFIFWSNSLMNVSQYTWFFLPFYFFYFTQPKNCNFFPIILNFVVRCPPNWLNKTKHVACIWFITGRLPKFHWIKEYNVWYRCYYANFKCLLKGNKNDTKTETWIGVSICKVYRILFPRSTKFSPEMHF